MSSSDFENNLATIHAMRLQEDNYRIHDNSSCSVDSRYMLMEWCNQMVDYCGFERETVAIAMSYFDRYKEKNATNFQLVAMTCLYTAIKIHEPEAMDPDIITNLSNNYTMKHVEETERSLLQSLQWRMNPPTPLSFVRILYDMVDDLPIAVFEMAKYQTELAVGDYDLAARASRVAAAALMNAAECCLQREFKSQQLMEQLRQVLSWSGIELDEDIRRRLYEAIDNDNNDDDMEEDEEMYETTQDTLPTCQEKQISLSYEQSPRAVMAPQ